MKTERSEGETEVKVSDDRTDVHKAQLDPVAQSGRLKRSYL